MGKRGVTLIEIIVVVAITAMISAFSLVSYAVYFEARLESEARKFVSDLAWARQIAVSRRETVYVDLNDASDLYAVCNSSAELKRGKLPVDLVSVTDFSGVPLVPATITFDFPNGTCGDTLVGFAWGGRSRNVRVFGETGYAKVE